MGDAAAATITPPFAAPDVAGFVLATVAALYLFVWARDREAGLQWCALGAAFLSLWAFTDRLSVSEGPHLRGTWWHLPLVIGLAGMGWGLLAYFDPPARQRRLGALVVVVPLSALVATILWAAAGEDRIRLELPQFLIVGYCLGLAALAFAASRREPRCGHAAVGAALLAIPGLLVVLRLAGMPAHLLRYVGVLPYIALCLTLLAVSVGRRRVALQAEVAQRRAAQAELERLNATLEHRVAQRTEDLELAIAGLESFNRAVSHDLRGPLGGIAQLARMAEQQLRSGNPDPALRYLPVIGRQAEQTGRLVSALLELARSDDAPLRTEPTNLQAIAAEAAAALEQAQGAARVSIELGHLPPLSGDPALIGAVFTNLIGNARKFSRDATAGAVMVTGAADDRSVTVRVADNGVGFDADAAARLFEPFARLHGAQFEGHGIGLTIVRRAVERHGGRVWAEGRPGVGATFSFTLPR